MHIELISQMQLLELSTPCFKVLVAAVYGTLESQTAA